MRRAYVDVGDRQMHYRTGGSGSPVVLLHPSPLSSLAVAPIAQCLSDRYEVFAFDTPGYGQSDALAADASSLEEFLPTFVAAMDALGIDKTCLYGAATGAQFAIQFALKYPERVELLVLDSCGHISDEDCANVINRYFVDTTPRPDGGHLATVWNACRDLSVFFPWCETTREARLHVDVPPPEIIQNFVMGYLQAGPEYWRAYRPAFEAERAKYVQRLKVPTVVTRWESSIVLQMTDDLLAHDMPENVKTLRLTAGWDGRVDGIKDYLAANYHGKSRDAESAPRTGYKRAYSDIEGQQVHWRGHLEGDGRPVVVIHDPAGSSRLTDPIARGFGNHRPVIAIDLPGNGESDSFGDATPADYAKAVDQTLSSIGVDQVDVFGRYSGSTVGLELAAQSAGRVNHLWLSGALQFEQLDTQQLLDNYTPSVAPRWDGTHLLTAWHMMRDQALFWPWFARSADTIVDAKPKVDPEAIQLRVTELMKCGDRYRDAYANFFRYDLSASVQQSKANMTFVTPSWDPVAEDATNSAAALGQEHQSLPNDLADWGKALVG